MVELVITKSNQEIITIEKDRVPKNWSDLVKWLNDEKDGETFQLDGIPYLIKKETILQVIVNIPVTSNVLNIGTNGHFPDRTLQLAWKSLACLKK